MDITERTKQHLDENDFATIPVPEEKRRSWMTIGLVYIGCAISLSAFMLGGSLSVGLTLNQAILATFIGTSVLSIITFLCSKVGVYSNLSTSMIGKFAFGTKGAIIVAFFYAIVAWGWFGVQVGLFGETVATMYNLITGNTFSEPTIKVIMAVGGLLMMTTAIFGYKSIEKLSMLAVPLITILMAASLFKVLQGHSWESLQTAGIVGEPLSLGVGISIVAGSFMAGAVGSPDIVRYGKDFKQTVFATIFGFIVGFGCTVVVATICAKATNDPNIVSIMVKLGWGVMAMLVLVLAQWTSNDNNIYSASLGFSVVTDKIPKYKLAIMTGVIGTIFAVLGIANHMTPFFLLLSAFVPPIGGVYVADFFLNNRTYDFENLINIPRVRWESVAAWFGGTAIGFCTNPQPAGFGLFTLTTVSAIDSFIIAALIQIILMKAISNNK